MGAFVGRRSMGCRNRRSSHEVLIEGAQSRKVAETASRHQMNVTFGHAFAGLMSWRCSAANTRARESRTTTQATLVAQCVDIRERSPSMKTLVHGCLFTALLVGGQFVAPRVFADGPLSGVGSTIGQDAQDAGHAIAQGARQIGAAVKNGAQDAGAAIKNGAQEAGAAIKTGAQHTGTAIKTGAQDTGTAIKTGAQDTGTAIKTGAQDTGTAIKTGSAGHGHRHQDRSAGHGQCHQDWSAGHGHWHQDRRAGYGRWHPERGTQHEHCHRQLSAGREGHLKSDARGDRRASCPVASTRSPHRTYRIV
jgi:hypothetical protein